MWEERVLLAAHGLVQECEVVYGAVRGWVRGEGGAAFAAARLHHHHRACLGWVTTTPPLLPSCLHFARHL